MIKKIVYFMTYVLVGIIYVDLGLVIDEIISISFSGVNFKSYFVPLVVIDVIIALIYLIIFKVMDTKNIAVGTFLGYLVVAIFVSIVSSIGWSIIRFIFGMNF